MRTYTRCSVIPMALTLALLAAMLCALPSYGAGSDGTVTVVEGDRYRLEEGATIGGSLIVDGGRATIAGRIRGQAIVLRGTLDLGQTSQLDGSLLTMGGNVNRHPEAQVTGEQRSLTAAEFAQLLAQGAASEEGKQEPEAPAEPAEPEAPAAPTVEVDEDRAGFGEKITIPAGEVRVGDVASFGGPIVVEGEVRGDVASFAGPVTVIGTVDGDIATFGGAVKLEDGSRVTGDIATFGAAVDAAPGAFHGGRVVGFGEGLSRLTPGQHRSAKGSGWLMGTIVSLLLALLIVGLFPNATRTVADAIVERPGAAAAHGGLTLLLLAPVSVVLALTCVLLPVVPVLIVAVVAAWLLGAMGVNLLIGRAIARRLSLPVTSLIGFAVIGVLALRIIDLLQFTDGLFIINVIVVGLPVLVFGLGGAVMTGLGTVPDGTWITRGGRGREADEMQGYVPPQGLDLSARDDEIDLGSEPPAPAGPPPPPVPPAEPDPGQWAPPTPGGTEEDPPAD